MEDTSWTPTSPTTEPVAPEEPAAPIPPVTPVAPPPPRPGCSCKKRLLILGILGVILLALVAVVVGAFFIFNPFGSNLPKYAPEDTDLIVYINGKKISERKIYRAWKKTRGYENMAAAAKEEGISIDKVFKGEACVFFNLESAMRSKSFSIVYRGQDEVAGKLFKVLKKSLKDGFDSRKESYEKYGERYGERPPKLSTDEIDGKQAVVAYQPWGHGYGDGHAVILLDKNTIQYSFARRKSELIDAPMTKNSTKLTRAVDTGALVSVAWRGEVPKKLLRDLQREREFRKYLDIAEDLEQVTLNIYDAGADLELKLVAEYKNKVAAKDAAESLSDLRKFLRSELSKDRQVPYCIVDMLKKLEISISGTKVIIRLKYSERKLGKLLEDL